MNENAQTLTMADFVASRGITIKCKRVVPSDARAKLWKSPGARHFTVTLMRGSEKSPGKPYAYARMSVPYSQGSAWTTDPTAADVLDSLASDAFGVDNARDFSDWCADYGYDTDSRAAERTWNQCKRLRDYLHRFLGHDDYEIAVSLDRL